MMLRTTRLIRQSDSSVLLANLQMATTFWSRLLGLQFRRSLASGHGLLLRPCSSLHTCFMRFPIDVVMLDHENRVLAVRRSLLPWRAMFCVNGTVSVIETNVGELDIPIGTSLQFDG